MQILAYLTFNGNCREAMTFYQQCLGGTLTLQTIGDSPMANRLPSDMQSSILHATLTHENLILMGSDMVGENGLIRGNTVSLMLECDSQPEINTLYSELSAGGTPTHPLENTFWGAVFGGLTDRFGINWLLHWENK